MRMPWELPPIAEDPLAVDREVFARFTAIVRALGPWFRPTIEGADTFSRVDGAVVVANHGYFALDSPFLIELVHRKTGRILHGSADRVLFKTPVVRELFWGLGTVEGSRENAHRVLTSGGLVYATPGGAREALAGEDVRYDLMWDNHYGFARVALKAQVPVVPIAVIGSADIFRQVLSAKDLGDGGLRDLIEAMLGNTKYVPFLPAGLGFIPLPEKLHFIVGEPVAPPAGPEGADDRETVKAYAEQVRDALTQMLKRGLAEREEREAQLVEEPGFLGSLTRGLRALRAK